MGYNRLVEGAILSASEQNRNWQDVETLSRLTQGHVVLRGLRLSPGEGLSVVVEAGSAALDKLVNVEPMIVRGLPPSSTTYLWLRDDGAVTITPTDVPPMGTHTLLGTVTTGLETVLGVDDSIAWRGRRVEANVLESTGPNALCVRLDAVRVGIGTISPSDPLHVSGTLRADALSLPERVAPPPEQANRGSLYTRQIAGRTELFFRDDAGNEAQLTSDGRLAPGTFLPLSGGTMSGNIGMNGHRLLGLPAAEQPTEAVSFSQMSAHSIRTFLVHTGSWAQIQNTTRYLPLVGYRGPSTGGEAFVQTKIYRHPHTFRDLRVYVSANSTQSPSIVVLRADGTDTSLSVTVPPSQTGEFENTGSTVMVPVSSRVCHAVHAGGGGSGMITVEAIQVEAVTS